MRDVIIRNKDTGQTYIGTAHENWAVRHRNWARAYQDGDMLAPMPIPENHGYFSSYQFEAVSKPDEPTQGKLRLR